MNEALLQQFKDHWANFIASLRGNLSRMKKLRYHEAEMAIEAARMDWIARDTVYGRWFLKLEKENPQIAQVVADILTKDMKFTECKDAPDYSAVLQYAIPAAGACVAGASYHFMTQAATLLASAAVPVVAAGVLYVAAKPFSQNRSRMRQQKTLDVYIDQLSVYYDSVIAALKA